MFTIYLKGVKVFAYHGVNPEENRDGQYFYLDVTAKTVTQAKELELFAGLLGIGYGK